MLSNAVVGAWQRSDSQFALAGSSTRQSTAAGSAAAQAAAPEGSSAAASGAPTASSSQVPAEALAQDQSSAARLDAGATANATGAAPASQQPAGQQQHQDSSSSQTASGSRRHALSGDNVRHADGRRQRRSRRPAISPVVTMALGSLLQSTLQGDAYRDPAGVLTNAAQLLLSSTSFEGSNRQQILVGATHVNLLQIRQSHPSCGLGDSRLTAASA